MKTPRKIRVADKPKRKVDPKAVAKALGAEPMPPKAVKALKVRMTKQVKLFLQGIPDDERGGVLDLIEKIAKGDLQGKLLTPEEVEQLKTEEGIDLEAALRETDDAGQEN